MTPDAGPEDETEIPERTEWWLIAGVAIFAGLLLLPALGTGSLQGDEMLYAAVERDSAASGRLIPLRVDGGTYLQKPLGGFLLLRGARALLPGADEIRLRLPSALSGIALALVLLFAGRRFGSSWAGALAAALILLTPTALSRHAFRGATFDGLTTLLVTLALLAWIELFRPSSLGRSSQSGRLAGFLVLSTQLKHLAAPALAAAAMLLGEGLAPFSMREPKHVRRFRRRAVVTAVVGALAAFGLWLSVLASTQELPGAWVIARLVDRDIVERAMGRVKADHVRGALYFVYQLGADFGAVLFAVGPFLYVTHRGRRAARAGEKGPNHASRIALLAWPMAMLLALTAFKSKNPWYLLPAYPALALILGLGLVDTIRLSPRRLRRVSCLLVGLAVASRLPPAVHALDSDPPRSPLDETARFIRAQNATLVVDPGLEIPARERLSEYVYLQSLRKLEGTSGTEAGDCIVALLATGSSVDEVVGNGSELQLVLRPAESDWRLFEDCGGRLREALQRAGISDTSRSKREPGSISTRSERRLSGQP